MINGPVDGDELTLCCTDGIVIRGQRWRTENATTNRRRQGNHPGYLNGIHPNLAYSNETSSSTLSSNICHAHQSNHTSHESLRILCLHGFMDNCRSFYQLAPKIISHFQRKNDSICSLKEDGRPISSSSSSRVNDDDVYGKGCEVRVDLVAFDFPGHGQSSHKSADSTPTIVVTDCVHYVMEVVSHLGWDDLGFVLIGHSMGGIVSVVYAASFPNQVQKLFLLDSYGPDCDRPESVSARIRRHVQERYEYNTANFYNMPTKSDNTYDGTSHEVFSRRTFPTKVYRSVDDAVATRLQTARQSPGGHQWISIEAGKELVQRATHSVRQQSDDITDGNNPRDGVQFIHDNRLKHHHLMIHTVEEVDGYWKNLQCPVYCLMAQEGWPFHHERMARSYRWVGNPPAAVLSVHSLPGSHHFHADPATAEIVAETILQYI
jgi:pimeloyl-ACP methyl ester carboxylesterase